MTRRDRATHRDQRTERWLASLRDDNTTQFEGASETGQPEPEGLRLVREGGERAWTAYHEIRDVLGFQEIPLHADTDPAPIAATVARGFTHLFTVTCTQAAAPVALPIPCDQSHSDDQAGTYDALYRSAWDAGWRLDETYRWHCPNHAQLSGLYRALWPVQLHALTDEQLLERTRQHYDASHDRGRHAREMAS